MKHNRIKLLLPLLLCIASLSTSAHSFEVDGIFYAITSSTDLTVEVTYRGSYYDSYYNEYSGQVTIPETVAYNAKTYRVTSIGSSAFSGCSSLTAVTISNSVTSIGSSAFSGCSGLTAVTIPGSVTSMGSGAFYGTGWYNNIPNGILYLDNWLIGYKGEKPTGTIEIAEGTKGIAGEAFYGCSGLTAVTIPNSVTSIGNYAFSGCSGLTAVTIGNSVTSIGSEAFYGANLKKTIWLTNTPPSGYTYAAGTINYVANEQYTSLSNKTVYPFLSSLFEVDGIKYVPVSPSERTCDAIDCVFDSTAAHTKILPTATYRGVTLKVLNVKPYVCYNNDFIKDLVVDNDGIIATSAFENCDSLETALIGKKITAIGDNAFKSCAKLLSIIIPDSVKTLGSYSFSGCSALETIHIGASVKEIGSYAFQGCKSLPSISIPAATTDIKDYVFSGCNGLKTVLIEDRKAELNLGSNYNSPLFADCPLDSVYIGGNITYSTSSYSGYSPFYRNTTLRSVTITDKETEISPNEFYGCTNLQNVRIGDGVTTIGDWAFSGCSSLSYFAFGTKVNSIGKEAFSDCTNVSSIISDAATPPVCGSQALDDINKWNCTLYVPKGYTKQYQEADQWKEFFFVEETDFVPPIDLTEEFGKDFFTDISILVSVISAGNYDNTFDVNGDGKIDIGDIMTVIKENTSPNDYNSFFYEIGNESGWSISHVLASDGNGMYKGYYYLNGEFKFKPNMYEWDNDLEYVRGTSTSGILTDGGGPSCPDPGAGFYEINLNLNDMSYNLNKIESVSIIGGFNDWCEDLELTYNQKIGCWEGTATLKGEFKFRANHDWSFNWGGSFDSLHQYGSNLMLDAGTYNFKVYLTYEGDSHVVITRL